MTNEPRRQPIAAWRWHLGLGLGFTALALVMTWPLGSPGARLVPDMNDAFFNIWRLSWVAHQLVHQPAALFDANIFYPARHTLAYSDAMLLVGLAGAPFLWAGVPHAVVHNGLLIAALASLGVGVGRARPPADRRPRSPPSSPASSSASRRIASRTSPTWSCSG